MYFRISAPLSSHLAALGIATLLLPALNTISFAADDKEKAKAVTEDNGKNFDAEGSPTFSQSSMSPLLESLFSSPSRRK